MMNLVELKARIEDVENVAEARIKKLVDATAIASETIQILLDTVNILNDRIVAIEEQLHDRKET